MFAVLLSGKVDVCAGNCTFGLRFGVLLFCWCRVSVCRFLVCLELLGFACICGLCCA